MTKEFDTTGMNSADPSKHMQPPFDISQWTGGMDFTKMNSMHAGYMTGGMNGMSGMSGMSGLPASDDAADE